MKKIFTLFAALTLSVGLAQAGCVFTYTATEKLEDLFYELGWPASHDFNNGAGTVTYDEEITAIGGFEGCTALQSINLPTCVTEIGNYAFRKCSNLQSINLSNVTVISLYAFEGCTSLQSIDMLNITTIREMAFNSCGSLQSITLPATLTMIDGYAFCGCTGVTSVTFLGTSCTIGDDAFGYVGFTTPAALTLPAGWTGTKPDQDGLWYGGYFKVPGPATVKATYIDENGASQEVDAIEITNSSATLAAGWYVVNGPDVQTSTLVCEGEVHLILADGAKLTATGKTAPGEYTPGIQVLGEGNSLIIYGQTAQSGQLIANGGENAAGIGGSGQISKGNGSNITINGGIVTATGGQNGAGIGGGYAYNGSSGSNITINGGTVTATGGGGGAGIGGGYEGSGSNITINGGIVTANSEYAAGIGGGYSGSASNIFVATSLAVKADNNNPPTTVIENDGSDLASKLAGKQYVTVEESSEPTALPKVNEGVKGNKFMHNGQVIIRKNGKTYNALGQKL